MRVALHGKPSLGILLDIAKGFEEEGHSPVFRRDSVWSPDQVEDFDVVVVQGLRGKAPEIRDAYRKRGVPVLVADAGHLRRDLAYFRISLDTHEWIAPGPCPGDRFAALGVEVKPRSKGGNVLILGQLPLDSSHNWPQPRIVQWLRETIDEIRTHTDRPIVYRPHPKADFGFQADGVEISWPHERSLADDLAEAHVAVTVCSTAGLEAIVAGVPTCTASASFYDELAFKDLALVDDPPLPSKTERRDFCRRVAYTQWTVAELHTGEPQRHYLAWIAGENPFSGDEETASEPETVESLEAAPEPTGAKPEPPVSPAVYKALKKAKLLSPEAVRAASDADLRAIRGVGPKVLKALRGWAG